MTYLVKWGWKELNLRMLVGSCRVLPFDRKRVTKLGANRLIMTQVLYH